MKKLSFLLISIVVILVVGIPIYDIVAFFNNKSLISPINEFIYQLAFPSHKYWAPIVKIPLTNDILTTTVSHIHRGKYHVDVWIPERMKDFTEIKEDIKIRCTFEKKTTKQSLNVVQAIAINIFGHGVGGKMVEVMHRIAIIMCQKISHEMKNYLLQ